VVLEEFIMTRVKYDKRLPDVSPRIWKQPGRKSYPDGVKAYYFPTEDSWNVFYKEITTRLGWRCEVENGVLQKFVQKHREALDVL